MACRSRARDSGKKSLERSRISTISSWTEAVLRREKDLEGKGRLWELTSMAGGAMACGKITLRPAVCVQSRTAASAYYSCPVNPVSELRTALQFQQNTLVSLHIV